MFALSGGVHPCILPGLHNVVMGSSRSGGHARAQSRPTTGFTWKEAARRLESLSPAEVKVLSTHSAQILEKLVSSPLPLDKICPSWEKIFTSALSSLTPPKGCSLLQESLFLSPSSPLLINARGFKTKARPSITGFSSFNKLKKGREGEGVSEDERFREVLNKLNISPSEKEKVHIALLSYASGAQADAGEKTTGKGKEAPSMLGVNAGWVWSYVGRLANILIIVAIVISLAQIYGWPILSRVTRGANEIAPEDIEVTFDDVKGCDEAKTELQEVVEFLMNPEKFSALGGKLPKGCLLVGPPGTGKTLLARAVAGQAGVPFFYASGSEFDEVLVGQGARRVRDLFKAAKERAPCVIFLDEIDSVGSKRSSSELHPYANQTINQLLSEMDGFVSNEGVIVLGATNRSEDLDKALLRPGRFDTQVEVPNPDVKGRREILGLYLNKIKHDDSVDIGSLAARTTGFSGADLQNLVNTAAIRAAVRNKEWVGMAEMEIAYDRQTMGTEWKSRVRPREDLEITAYHEAGHTLVAYLNKDAMPLHKVTILAKGHSGGHTGFTPTENMQWHQTKAQMKALMDVSMGGRVAEEIIFGKDKVTSGASSDLQKATEISERMVKYLGMGDKVGLRVCGDPRQSDTSPATREMTDIEIKLFLDDSYKRATNVLTQHKKELILLAEALLKYETLDADDVKCIVEHKRPPPSKQPSPPTTGTLLGFRQPPLPGLSPAVPSLTES